MAKGCALSTGYLPQGGLPSNSVERITDRPDITSAVDRGRKASTHTNNPKTFMIRLFNLNVTKRPFRHLDISVGKQYKNGKIMLYGLLCFYALNTR